MEPSTDTELQELFREEVADRARRLLEASEAMAAGSREGWDPGALARDAHTIKGSCRVMGYPVMARGAELLELAWKRIGDGRSAPDQELGVRLREVSLRLPPAVEAPAEEGTPELLAAIEELETLEGVGAAGPAGGQGSIARAPSRPVVQPEPLDLGGLLSSLEEGVGEGTTIVETGRLYRLINRLAELRVETDALRQSLTDLGVAPADDVADRIARWEQGLEGLQRTADDLQEQAVALAGTSLREFTDTLPRLARYVAGKLGKEIRVELIGDRTEVDRQVAERVADPLRHLLVNAIDHGIEVPEERASAYKPPTGTVSVRAESADGRLRLVVEDDGRGVDWQTVERVAGSDGLLTPGHDPSREELVRILFTDGFTTSSTRTEFSGDGSGLALVADAMDALGGSATVRSQAGEGTRVEMTVPAWRALQDAVLVRVGDHHWGIPAAAVVATLPFAEARFVSGGPPAAILWGEQRIPAGSFAAAVGLGEDEEEPNGVLVLSTTRGGLVAVTVPEVLGSRQVATKALGPLLGGAPVVAGAAVLGGGEIVAMVDPNRLGERLRRLVPVSAERPAVLVVDDSVGVRRLMSATLAGQGFEPVVAGDAEEALRYLAERRFDALVVDYSMPGSDGVELAASARATDPDLPIVMVSGVATDDDQTRAREAGVDAYFDKSDLREGGLASTLGSLIEARRLEVGS